jgi:hypothetical protein
MKIPKKVHEAIGVLLVDFSDEIEQKLLNGLRHDCDDDDLAYDELMAAWDLVVEWFKSQGGDLSTILHAGAARNAAPSDSDHATTD